MQRDERIAIVGMGGIFPASDDLPKFWSHILHGDDCCREVPPGRWILPAEAAYAAGVATADKVYSTRGGFIEGFRAETCGLSIETEQLSGLDVMFQLAVEASRRALADAVTSHLDRSRVGVVLGNIVLPTDASTAFAADFLGRSFEEKVLRHSAVRRARGVHPLNRYVAGLPAGIVASAFGLGGGNYALDAACASSLYALKFAADQLREGRADAMLAGGVSRPDSLYTQMGFAQLQALSKSGCCAPLDAGADGLVVGEGAGVVVLKRLADALRDGDRIYATIAGIGLSNDREGRLMAPRSEGQLRAMRDAYRQSEWSPDDVQLVECHATGTPVGDAVELESLHRLWAGLASTAQHCVIGSVKSNVGHLLTGAGAAGLVKVLLAMQHGTLPPTANFRTPAGLLADSGSPFRALREAETWNCRNTPRRAAINAFGFGGINAHVLLESWDAASASVAIAPPVRVPREPREAVAIVGMAAHFGPWDNLRAFQHRVLGGGPREVPSQDPNWWGAEQSDWFHAEGRHGVPRQGYYVGEVRIPVDRFRIPPKELEEMLPQQLLMLQVAAGAVEDAALEGPLGNRTGVFVGIGLDLNTTNFHVRWSLAEQARAWERDLGLALSEEQRAEWVRRLRESAGPALSANRTMGALGGIVASRLAREFGVGGPSLTLSSEDSSGLRALDVAVQSLRRHEIDRALVGAVDLAGDVRAVLAANAVRPYSETGTARPFDANADGAIVGEGAAAFVLKRLDDAVRDDDRIYAVIKGVGSAGGGGVGDNAHKRETYSTALRRAYEDAGVEPRSIGLLVAQGSGHREEDRIEAEALAEFFSAQNGTAPCALASAVADVGHTGAASGAASLVKAVLSLYHEIVPPIRNLDTPRPEFAAWAGAYLPKQPQCWLHNREDGPRRAGVSSVSVDGSCLHAVLEAFAGRPAVRAGQDGGRPLGALSEAMFTVDGASKTEMAAGLDRLQALIRAEPRASMDELARRWYAQQAPGATKPLAIAMVSRDRGELARQVERARSLLQRQTAPLTLDAIPANDRVFFSPNPMGRDAGLAFVFPGSGNDFPGMGRELCCAWPEILRRQHEENRRLRDQFVANALWNPSSAAARPRDHKQAIFSQVALGSAVCDLMIHFGIRPSAAIGYSLGESAALFAFRAWTDRDEMLARMRKSSLFGSDLVRPFEAARKHWRLPEGSTADWVAGVINCSAEAVWGAVQRRQRVYLLIVNHASQCVIGGERSQVDAVVRELECAFVPSPDPASVHCEIVGDVRQAYRELHLLPTTPPEGIRFFSAAKGRVYRVDRESAAGAIVSQAVATIDFPNVIEAAYRDGVRVFVEMGPGATCSRLIAEILADRPHIARSACHSDRHAVMDFLCLLAQLYTERLPIDLNPLYGASDTGTHAEAGTFHAATDPAKTAPACIVVPVGGRPFEVPPPPSTTIIVEQEPYPLEVTTSLVVHEFAAAQTAKAEAHQIFLRLSGRVMETARQQQEFQYAILREMQAAGIAIPTAPRRATSSGIRIEPSLKQAVVTSEDPPRALSREQCLEFAVGSIGDVLGPLFAAIDAHPTRVRLPDEPLMLVDRVVAIDGEPASMGAGRVVTEHDVRPDAWYLDCGRIPTCIAVEAGQADLFLSGFLGIDFETQGRAMYRLLDAAVTFHRGLPSPGSVIRYDIRINRFFQQAETHFFRFEFDGTVDGELLLTMRDGCAGFFTPAQLNSGQGVVRTTLDCRPMEGRLPADWQYPVPMVVEGYAPEQLRALRRGDFAGCFGPDFAHVTLGDPVTIPGGRMELVHRVLELDPVGGRFGLGKIRAEADIHPDDWFLKCHFHDDHVMPGTLLYECCLHTLRIFLLRLGWLGEREDVVCEPVPGVTSRLECRGQVIAGTRTVTYEVSIKELGYNPAPYAIADALVYADGKPVVNATDVSVQLTGLTREAVSRMWSGGGSRKPALYDRDRILAFSIGKPSEAFGNRYRIFDEGRIIARLPGPPFLFADRVTGVWGEPWQLQAGARTEIQYDVPPDAWYFASNRQTAIPFAVLLEIALQPCGWLAAYCGSALTGDVDLAFRNLGGTAVQHETVTPETGTLTTTAVLTGVSKSGGMIIQNYDFRVCRGARVVYEGDTYFGFFSREALSRQVGVKDAKPYALSPADASHSTPFPDFAPFPDARFRMVDRIESLVMQGGPHGHGFVKGTSEVDADAWFFQAHFYQDPVWPGSLGLESFLQLLKVYAGERWGGSAAGERTGGPAAFQTPAIGRKHGWTYRGQVIPENKVVTVEAGLTCVDDSRKLLEADGLLSVDGRVIYQMSGFSLEWNA